MRTSFEASLPARVERAAQIELQNIIPSNWFAAAASESAGMYVAGFFYGAISTAHAYVEGLSKFLVEKNPAVKGCKNDTPKRLIKLRDADVISEQTYDALQSIFNNTERNDFHHLNECVEQDYFNLEQRAKECINHLHTIESEVFAYSFNKGSILPQTPRYWPINAQGLAVIHMRRKET